MRCVWLARWEVWKFFGKDDDGGETESWDLRERRCRKRPMFVSGEESLAPKISKRSDECRIREFTAQMQRRWGDILVDCGVFRRGWFFGGGGKCWYMGIKLIVFLLGPVYPCEWEPAYRINQYRPTWGDSFNKSHPLYIQNWRNLVFQSPPSYEMATK